MEVISREADFNISAISSHHENINVIALVEDGIRDAIGASEGVIQKMCDHIAKSGGKRIRPQLVLHSALAFSKINGRMISVAVAAELIHMASLVHDDIIDVSALRRGKPSVNKQWGNHSAVLCGDWLFAKAFGILSGVGLPECMGYMVEAISCMCHGELLQAANKNILDIGIDMYFEQIKKKTAKLLECSCRSGAITGGADNSGIKALGEFGLNIGMAFQIIDDILDFRGNPVKMGKPNGEDLRQGIITLPVILLLQDEKYGSTAKEMLSKNNYSAKDTGAINGMLISSGAIDKAYTIAGSFIDAAQNCLKSLQDSKSRIFLSELASSLRRRDN